MKHYDVHFQPDNVTTSIHAGATLLEAAGQAGIILSTPCGGMGRCGKCTVRLLPSEKEVMACQYIIGHDVTALIPDSSRFFRQQILEHGIQRKMEGFSSIRKVFLNTVPSQFDPLCETLTEKISAQVVLPNNAESLLSSQFSSCQEGGVTAILSLDDNEEPTSPHHRYQLTGIEKGDTTERLYGAAVDIGTTTVVLRLVNLNTCEIVTNASIENPQSQYGHDVISRISHCENESGPEQLQTAIITCLNKLLETAAGKIGIEPHDIYEMTIVGNTTMHHLLLRCPVRQLGQAPYKPHSLASDNHSPSVLGLDINPGGNIHTLCNIAGFVGSDTVAATLACGLDISDICTLLVDIGTNGEIVFGTKTHLLAASCAAGPALEGAGITFGSRAQSGAIERVFFDGDDIDVDIIGSGPTVTICGSGLIDAVAVMLELQIIDTTGRFYEATELDPMLSDSLRKRLIIHDNKPAFVLAGEYTENRWKNPVFLTQTDIRQMQLAKSAIRAGIELLLRKAHSNAADIEQLLLAGAFGNYIQKENAVRIGLLPQIPPEKIHFVGNAAGSGAQMALVSRNARKMAKELAKDMDYMEIAHQADFQTLFSDFMLFPDN